jgi:hypothetical protein
LLQYLAIAAPKLVWSSFGSWLRTIRPDIPPSEFVVAKALRQTLPEFLMGPAKSDSLTKFIVCHSEYLKSSHFPHTLVLHQGFRPGVWPLRQASDGRHPTVIPMIRA